MKIVHKSQASTLNVDKTDAGQTLQRCLDTFMINSPLHFRHRLDAAYVTMQISEQWGGVLLRSSVLRQISSNGRHPLPLE